MNEILSAIFGAGVSILFTELIDYCSQCRELEDRLLRQAERVISSFARIETFCPENLRECSGAEALDLILDYLDEEETNQSRVRLVPVRHEARDKLIRLIEGCGEDDCEEIAQAKYSSFNRYVSRLKEQLKAVCRAYRACADSEPDQGTALLETIGSIFLLPIRLPSLQRKTLLASVSFCNAQKKRLLREMRTAIDAMYGGVRDVAGEYRLFEVGESGYHSLLDALIKSEKQQAEDDRIPSNDSRYGSGNRYAIWLFRLVSEYAHRTSSSLSSCYEKPWW